MKTIFTTLVLSLLSLTLCAQLDYTKLLNAYLEEDMTIWSEDLHQETQRDDLSLIEKAELANYLYAYLAYVSSVENEKEYAYFEPYFLQYIQSMQKNKETRILSNIYHCYYYTLGISRKPWNAMWYGHKAQKYLDKAAAMNLTHPLVLGCQGDMYFYKPSLFGGDKKLAVNYYVETLRAFEDSELSDAYAWNICYFKLSLIQAYSKTGQTKKAHNLYETLKKAHPNYKFLQTHSY